MRVWVLRTDDYVECDCGCYFESVEAVFSSYEKAEAYVKIRDLRKHHYSIDSYEVV